MLIMIKQKKLFYKNVCRIKQRKTNYFINKTTEIFKTIKNIKKKSA